MIRCICCRIVLLGTVGIGLRFVALVFSGGVGLWNVTLGTSGHTGKTRIAADQVWVSASWGQLWLNNVIVPG